MLRNPPEGRGLGERSAYLRPLLLQPALHKLKLQKFELLKSPVTLEEEIVYPPKFLNKRMAELTLLQFLILFIIPRTEKGTATEKSF